MILFKEGKRRNSKTCLIMQGWGYACIWSGHVLSGPSHTRQHAQCMLQVADLGSDLSLLSAFLSH